MRYLTRYADTALADRLQSVGAVVIEGPKGCGKTETATQIAASILRFDADEQVRLLEVICKSYSS